MVGTSFMNILVINSYQICFCVGDICKCSNVVIVMLMVQQSSGCTS